MRILDTRDTQYTENLVRIFTANFGTGGSVWSQEGSDKYYRAPRRFQAFVRHDWPAWSFPHMQDYLADTWSLNAAPTSSGEQDWQYVLVTPSINVEKLHVSAGSGRMAELDWRYVLDTMVGRDSLPYDPMRVVNSGLKRYEELQRKPISKYAVIDQKDPLDSEFSIWYLAVDLWQMPKLAKQILKVGVKLARAKRSLGKVACSEASNNYLMVKFGLLPTLQDIRDLMDIMIKWASHVGSKEKFAQKTYTRHEKQMLSSSVSTEQYFFSRHGVQPIQVDLTHVVDRFLARTTKFYFVYPELAGVLDRIKVLVDILGLADPTVFWDLVPFSFVVDWILDVSGWIHKNLKKRQYPADMVVCDWAESLVTQTTLDGTLTYRRPYPGVDDSVDEVMHITGTHRGIVRCRQAPRKLQIVTTNTFTKNSIIRLNRAFVGAAIVSQRNRVKIRSNCANYTVR